MPTVEPIQQPGTITIQARTVSSRSPKDTEIPKVPPQQLETQTPPEKKVEALEEEKQKPDERVLKARLVQERLRRELEVEKKKLAEERRELEIAKANSRKWQEAAELAQQGRYVEASEKAGITYDQLTSQIINGGQVLPAKAAETTAEAIAKKEIDAFKKQLEEQDKQKQQQQYENAMKLVESDIKHLVDSSDKYPLVKASGSYQDIAKEFESEFHRTGRLVPLEELLQRWEDEALAGFQELYKLDTVRNKLSPQEESPKPIEERVPQTLSQRVTAPVPGPKPMTDAERRQRAIDAFHGRLR